MSSGSIPPVELNEDSGVADDSVDDYKSFTESLGEEFSTSTQESPTDDWGKDFRPGGIYSQELQSGQPPIDRTGRDELVGGRKHPDIKERTDLEDYNSGKPIRPEDIKVMKKCIKTTTTAILQFHEGKEQLLITQSASYSAQQQPTSRNYNEMEVLDEANSIASILETVKKILRLKPGHDKNELKYYCDVFLKELPAGQAERLPSSAQLVGIRNGAAHSNAEYYWDWKCGSHITPTVVLYEKKRNSERYNEVYMCSPADFVEMSCKLRKLFLCDWKPLREYIPRPNFSNGEEEEVVSAEFEEEVVSPVEEESSFNNLGTGSLVFLVTFLYHGLHVSGVLYL